MANNVSWSTVKAPYDVADLLHTTTLKSKDANTVTNTCGLYSLQESCDLLQSSYDDLFDDDDNEDVSAWTKIIHDHGDALSCTSNSKTSVNDVTNDGATSDSDIGDSVDNCNDRFAMQNSVDLYSPDMWESYYTRLQDIGRAMKDREGWPNFDAVFMISAIDGDGIFDIKVNKSCFL